MFVVNNLLAGAICLSLADLTMRRRDGWRRALAGLSLFPGVVLLTVLVLGSAGRLTAGWAGLVLAPVAAALVPLWWRWGVPAGNGPEAAGPSASGGWSWWLAAGVPAGAIGLLAVRLGVGATGLIWDDLEYHAAAVAEWIVAGRLVLAPQDYHAYFPANAETLSLWFMLPGRCDGVASLTNLYWACVLATATGCLCRMQGVDRARTALVAAAVLIATPVARTLGWFVAVDVAATGMMLTAVAMLARPRSGRSGDTIFNSPSSGQGSNWNGERIKFGVPGTPGTRLADVALAGLAAGYAVGAKVSMVPAMAVLVGWVAMRRDAAGRRRGWAIRLAVFVGFAALTGSYWYLRNLYLTGNPLFPAQIGPLAGPFTAAHQARTKLIGWLIARPVDWGQWRIILQQLTDWPKPLCVLAVLGYGAGLHAWWRGRRSGDRPAATGLLLTVGLVSAAVFPLLPWSAGYNLPDAPLLPQARYLIGPFVVGLILWGLAGGRWRWTRLAWWVLTGLAIGSAVAGLGGRSLLIALCCAVATLAAWPLAAGWIETAWRRRIGVAAVVTAALALSAAWQAWGSKQRLTDQRLYQFKGPDEPIGLAWEAVESLPAGSKIAWFGPHAGLYYPLFGRRLQHVPVAVSADGRRLGPLHERFKLSPEKVTWWPYREPMLTADGPTLVENLRRSGIDYVLLTRFQTGRWWPHKDALVGSGQVMAVYDDGYSMILAIRSGTPNR